MNLNCKICNAQLVLEKNSENNYQCYCCPNEKIPRYLGHYVIGFRIVDTAIVYDCEDFIYYPFYIMKRINAMARPIWYVGCDWDKPGALFSFTCNNIEFEEMFPDFKPNNLEKIMDKFEKLRLFA